MCTHGIVFAYTHFFFIVCLSAFLFIFCLSFRVALSLSLSLSLSACLLFCLSFFSLSLSLFLSLSLSVGWVGEQMGVRGGGGGESVTAISSVKAQMRLHLNVQCWPLT